MNLKVLTVYIKTCKFGKIQPNLKDLNKFDKELKENPNYLEVFEKRLEKLAK